MRNGEILVNTPIFDYFHLQSFDKIDFWEWKLFDAHGGGWEFPGNGNWYISNKLKAIIKQYCIAPPYCFYETKLLYNGKKYIYWIFQFIASYRKLNKMQCVDFSKSIFRLDDELVSYCSYDDYLNISNDIYDKLKIDKIHLNSFYDFIPLNPLNSDIVVSDCLKTAIEENGITGFEFSEIDYEIITPADNIADSLNNNIKR